MRWIRLGEMNPGLRRAPMGPPPIMMANGFHCLPVWKGYIVACGDEIAPIIQRHRLNGKFDHQLKTKSHEWTVGFVILHPSLARPFLSNTCSFLHDDLGKLTEDLISFSRSHLD
jgi:hypothetical protein